MKNSLSSQLKSVGKTSKQFLGGLAVILLFMEFFIHRHAEVEAEAMPFFPAIYAFVICVVIVLGGIALRKIVMRGEAYYDND